MGKKSPRYVEIKVKGKPFTYMVSEIVYRDKRGRFAKFNPRRKLRVEVYAIAEVVDKKTTKRVLKKRLIRKHSLGFAKRKHPTTITHIKKHILKKALKSRGQLRVTMVDGLFKFVSDKIVPKNVKKRKGVKTIKFHKGSLDGYFKAFEASLSGNSSV